MHELILDRLFANLTAVWLEIWVC